MAKIDLKFIDCEYEEDFIKVEGVKHSENREGIIYVSGLSFGESFIISLDKSTAIKFAKTLRTEINKIKDSEEFDKLSNTF